MKWSRLKDINKPLFGFEDIAGALNISLNSAKVTATRYCSQGLLIRLKRNMYILSDNWNRLGIDELFKISNLLQTPSYISFTTALEYHGVTTQMLNNYVEAVAVKRTKIIMIEKTVFSFSKILLGYFDNYEKVNGFFIASPEKAFVDSIYLTSLGRYHLDMSAIDFNKLNLNRISEILKSYNERTKKFWENSEYAAKS